MRVLVCGGREFSDAELAQSVLDQIHTKTPITLLVEGGAGGADRLGFQWAKANGIRTVRFDADWLAHGKAAGPIRNRRMLVEGQPDLVVAFPGGRGTADMTAQARKFGVEVLAVRHSIR